MTASKIFRGIKKLFSATAYTPEEARSRLIKSVICLVIAGISTFCFVKGVQLDSAGTLINNKPLYYTLIAGYLSGLVALLVGTSLFGIIKALFAAFRLGVIITPFYLLDLITGVIFFTVALCAVLGCPVIIAAYGVYLAIDDYTDFTCCEETYVA